MINPNEIKENLTLLLSLTTTSEMTVDTDDVINALTAIEQLQAQVVELRNEVGFHRESALQFRQERDALAADVERIKGLAKSNMKLASGFIRWTRIYSMGFLWIHPPPA